MSQVAAVHDLRESAPPQDNDAEEYVLGAMMLSENAIAAAAEILGTSGKDFYREKHAKIYRAAVHLFERGEPVDAVTLANELGERRELEEVGGTARIHEIAALVPDSSRARHYAQIVRDMAVLRGLITAGGEIARLGWERGARPAELVGDAERIIFELSSTRVTSELTHIKDVLVETFDRISHLYENRLDVTGVASGFRDLDRITAGFQAGNLIILGARPAMGKSALGLNIAANVAVRGGTPCAFFALEMSKQEIVQRLLCSEAKVDLHNLRTGHLAENDWFRLSPTTAKLAEAPLYVDDTASLTMLELRSRAQFLKRRVPELGLLVVDYLQLMTIGGTPESRLQEISAISRGLKALARDLDVPILALSQLSRALEQRHDKRPTLSDLRESGTLEQDADVVMFLYRDDYYNPESDSPGVAELAVAKHRNGPTDTLKLAFIRTYAKFSDIAS